MNLTDPIFTDKDQAREYLERTRWADGVYCPHCGGELLASRGKLLAGQGRDDLLVVHWKRVPIRISS